MTTVLACLSPAAALAQSAGDEQYRDPLAGQNQGGNSSNGNSSGGNSNSSGAQSNSGSQQGTTTQQPQQGSGVNGTGTSTTTTPGTQAGTAATGKATLPRTGSDSTIPLGVLGAVLVLAGVTTRRLTRRVVAENPVS